MSSSDKVGCLTVVWKIQNFSLFRLVVGGSLSSPIWNILTNDENEWWTLEVENWSSNIIFKLVGLKDSQKLDFCEISIFSPCDNFPPRLVPMNYNSLKEFSIETDKIFGEDKESFIPQDTLTVFCKIWKTASKTKCLGINSNLQKVDLLWNIEMLDSTRILHDSFVEKDNLVFNRTLERKKKDGTYSLSIESVPSRYGWFSLVDCQLSIKDNKGGVFVSCYENFPCTRWRGDIKILNMDGILQFDHQLLVAVYIGSRLTDQHCGFFQWPLNDAIRTSTEGKFSALYANRSRLLGRILETDTIEAEDLLKNNEDKDEEEINLAIRLLYGKELEVLSWEEVSALHYFVERYSIQPLQQRCFEILKDGLMVTNALEAFVLAYECGDEQLSECVKDFICDHTEVVRLPEWNDLVHNNALLAEQIGLAIALRHPSTFHSWMVRYNKI